MLNLTVFSFTIDGQRPFQWNEINQSFNEQYGAQFQSNPTANLLQANVGNASLDRGSQDY